jgi:Glyoxalase-like domain
MNHHLDHIIWACNNLEHGSRRFEELTGIRPHYGGTHASGLTHNALVGLGGRCYLEILAPVGPATPRDDAWCRLAHAAQEPQVMTYCLRSSLPLADIASLAEARGWKKAVVASNGRTTPEGVRLHWQWLGPTVEEFGLALPFFIDWLDSPHPAESRGVARSDAEIRLRHFAVGHPHAAELRQTLTELGAPMETYAAQDVQFQLQLETPLGVVTL